MQGYFYIEKATNRQCGPFSIDELRTKGITRDTMIWFSGLTDWMKAGTIPALSPLFQNFTASDQTAPQNNGQYRSMYPSNVYGASTRNNNMEVRPMPKSWLIESILVTIFCAQIFGIIAIIYASKVESSYYAGDYETSLKSSKNAKMWMLIGLGITVGAVALLVIVYVVIIMAAIAGGVH